MFIRKKSFIFTKRLSFYWILWWVLCKYFIISCFSSWWYTIWNCRF